MSDPKSPGKKPKKRKSTARQRQAGKSNLLKFRPATPALKSGVHSLLATGEMPAVPGAAEVARAVEEIISGLVADLGGPDAITAAQQVIISGLRLSLQVQGLGEIHLKRVGVVDPNSKKPTALLTVLATFINSARLSALALGLDRRSKNVVKTLESTMREIAEREHSEAPESTDENIEKA